LGNLNRLLLGVLSRQVLERARKELLDRVPGGLFLPDGKDSLLVAWIGDGKRYSKGSRLHANIYEDGSYHSASLEDRIEDRYWQPSIVAYSSRLSLAAYLLVPTQVDRTEHKKVDFLVS
jgi:hypothetical protein